MDTYDTDFDVAKDAAITCNTFSVTQSVGDKNQHTHTTAACVEHHGVQPIGCMDNELEPSRGVPC